MSQFIGSGKGRWGLLIDGNFVWIIGLFIWVPFRILMFILRKKKTPKVTFSREFLLNLLFVYLIFLVSVTIFPIPIGIDNYGGGVHANFITFRSILGSLTDSWSVVPLRNIAYSGEIDH